MMMMMMMMMMMIILAMMVMMMVTWRNGGMEVGVATKNGDTCGKPCSQQKLRQTMYKLSRFCLFLVVHCKWNLDFRRAHCLQRS